MIKLLLALFLIGSANADEYWDVKVFDVPQAQVQPAIDLINGLDQTGVSISVMAWSPDDNIFRLGVGGANLSTFKTALRNAVQSQYGKLPEFDVVRSDPDEMDPKTRVCTAADVATYNPKIPAYFGSDLRGLGDNPYQNWLEPGNSYCQTRTGLNCDGTEASEAAVNSALTTWGNMNQCNRWRIRLHAEGTVYPHESLEKVHVYFANVPRHREDALRACLVPSEFIFLGTNRDAACERLNQIAPNFCARFTGF